MLSVRPSRCHSDTVCFSQVLLGNHSSPKLACLGVSHRTHPPPPFFPAACLSVFSLPFLCVFVLFCCPLLSPALFEHSLSAQAVVVRPALIHEVRGWEGTTKIGTFRVSEFKHTCASYSSPNPLRFMFFGSHLTSPETLLHLIDC